MVNPEASEQLTLAQAAQALGMSPRTVERWARERRIPCLSTGPGGCRFRRKDIVALVDGIRGGPGSGTTDA